MSFIKLFRPLVPTALIDLISGHYSPEQIKPFAFHYNDAAEVRADIEQKYGHHSELLELFVTNQDLIVHKWHHYIPLYDRYFSPYRGQKVRFLEIGVSHGGSLQMWRKYFGDDAVIFGIDIDPACEKFNGQAGQVRIGSQSDARFLRSVVEEMGGVDVVLDDGSHQMQHISASLKTLFPLLSYGGVYMIEDLHAAYWKSFGGGYRAQNNFFRFLRDVVDDMHHWYHRKGMKQAIISQDCSGIHIHDSLVVLEKNKVHKPAHSRIS